MNNQIKLIPLDCLLIDLENPRYDTRPSQRDALITMLKEQGEKLINLAEDIVYRGLNPSELPIVMPTEDDKTFIVLEGNRRLAALKLASSPELVKSLGLPPRLEKRFTALHDRAMSSLPEEISCVVLPREEANNWIMLKHTGENEGIGVVSWDGRARQRFRGSSPALQAIELVEEKGYLDDETKKKLPKIAITNIERILNTPEARKLIGVEVKNNTLRLLEPEEEALSRLAIMVSDVANREIRVTDIDTKEQRVKYAEKLASTPIRLPHHQDSEKGSKPQTTEAAGTESKSTSRQINPNRKTLIPRGFKVTINQPRINKIYNELQKLNIDSYPNSCAVLLRVFVELSIVNFGDRHNIEFTRSKKAKDGSLIEREMSLRKKNQCSRRLYGRKQIYE